VAVLLSGAQREAVVRRLREAGCVFAEDEAVLLLSSASSSLDLAAMVERRVTGEPLEQIVGWAEFCGLRIAVELGVFVPRRRSELLVREAVAHARDGCVAVDLCCGSGALGAAIASGVTIGELHAVDVDAAAVRCARRNLPMAYVYEGDLFDPLPRTLLGRIDILLANVPYVPSGELHLMPGEARVHEPNTALDGGTDGLEILRRVSAGAPRWLRAGGHVFVETSVRQAPLAARIFTEAGLIPAVSSSGELNAAVVIGVKPEP
jgi:release factor glutamine methyltransferase